MAKNKYTVGRHQSNKPDLLDTTFTMDSEARHKYECKHIILYKITTANTNKNSNISYTKLNNHSV